MVVCKTILGATLFLYVVIERKLARKTILLFKMTSEDHPKHDLQSQDLEFNMPAGMNTIHAGISRDKSQISRRQSTPSLGRLFPAEDAHG